MWGEKRRGEGGRKGKRALIYWGMFTIEATTLEDEAESRRNAIQRRYEHLVAMVECAMNDDNGHDMGRTMRENNRPLPCTDVLAPERRHELLHLQTLGAETAKQESAQQRLRPSSQVHDIPTGDLHSNMTGQVKPSSCQSS